MNGRIRVLDAVIVVALLSLLALNGLMVYRSLQLSAQPYALGRPLLYQAQDSKQKVIYVTGTGKASARPDIAVIYLAVKTQAEAASKAQSDNAATMSSVLEALKGSGVAESDLETTSYTLEPIMTYPENGTPRIVGYLCRNSIAVTVRDVEKAGAVIDAAVGAGANEVGSISFRVSSQKGRELYDTALREAVKDAGAKAEALGEGLGVKIIGPLEVSVSPGYQPEIVRYEAAKAGTPIIPGELTVTVDVQVSYLYE